MFSCAYELDLDIEDVRKELQYLNDPIFKDRGYDDLCFYVSDKTVQKEGCENIIKFKKLFNNGFVEGIRFLNMKPKQTYNPHVDSNEQGFHPDIPMDIHQPGNVNILLSKVVGDETVWYIDGELRRLQPWAFSKNGDLYPGCDNDSMGVSQDGLIEVDRWSITEKPTLFNTSVWHTIRSNDIENIRRSACFVFWPYNSFQGIVEAIRQKGYLIER
jgi:hypothetical protein